MLVLGQKRTFERAIHYAFFVAPEDDLNTLVSDLVRIELGRRLAVPAALE